MRTVTPKRDSRSKSYNWDRTDVGPGRQKKTNLVFVYRRLTLESEYGPKDAVNKETTVNALVECGRWDKTNSQAARIDMSSGNTYSATFRYEGERTKG